MRITLPQVDWVGEKVFLKKRRERVRRERRLECTSSETEREGACTYVEQDAGAPAKGEQVEDPELARLVELAVLGLGEVHLPVDLLHGRNRRDY